MGHTDGGLLYLHPIHAGGPRLLLCIQRLNVKTLLDESCCCHVKSSTFPVCWNVLVLHVTDGSILPQCQMVYDRPEVTFGKDLTHGRHFGVSSCPPFLPFKTENHILSTLNPSGKERVMDILASCDSIMHSKSSR